MRLREHVCEINRSLTKARADSPGLCARLLVCHVANIPPERYIFHSEDELPANLVEYLRVLTKRRASGEPLAYILGKKDFFEHEFIVSPATLTPRPETELLVDLALEKMPRDRTVFLDAGCGTGCVGLSLMAQRPSWRGVLMDISLAALNIARINSRRIAPDTELILGDIFSPPFACAEFDLLISNPPYIGMEEQDDVMPEVLAYEPHLALFSGHGGLAHLEALARAAMRLLRPGGMLMVEHGAGQEKSVLEIMQKAGLAEARDHKDLAGLPRAATARKHGKGDNHG